MSSNHLLIGQASDACNVALRLNMANRHGLVAGATGTGKTVTLQTMAEGFSKAGVPVFLVDVKGDLSGLAVPGAPSGRVRERIERLGLSGYKARGYPTLFWDLYGKRGHPVRSTISDMGPLLLANLLELNDTQSGVLYACFRVADDQGLLLLDLKDLRSMLSWVGDNRAALSSSYGNIAPASVASIQRKLLVLEEQGAEHFFGEPALALSDLMKRDFSGQGVVSILDATALMPKPRLYSTFLLWLLSELFEQLPEIGDPQRPELVLFFDEAHLLFDDAPKALQEKVEQVVRLIRSKGVGVYFISQNPLDLPEEVLGQLGNRVQHCLRAFTPRDQKAVRAAAQTFRSGVDIDVEQAITQLAVGEALASVLDEAGTPTVVQRTLICPPESRLGALTDEERVSVIERSPLSGRYENQVDRESAYEILKARNEQALAAADDAKESEIKKTRAGKVRQSDSILGSLAKSAARAIGTQVGRQIVRGILGSIFGGRR